MKKGVKNILLLVNAIILLALLYFTLTNYYSWKTHSVWLNPSYYSYEIRVEVRALVVLSVILPIILALFKKKYLWLIQSVVIIVILTNYKKDLFQKTIFINQPSSIQRTNIEIDKLIGEIENKLNRVIQDVNKKNIDTISVSDLNKYTEKESFMFVSVFIENKKVKILEIIPKSRKKNYHDYKLSYYPNNYDLKGFSLELSKFGEDIYVLNANSYFYKNKWVIQIYGVTSG